MSRNLVTGGAGFIGSALANRLARDGHEVTVFDRFSRGKESRLREDVYRIAGDIRDEPAVRDAVWGQDVIWHLAYVQGTQTFYADPWTVIDVALSGIMNVLNACRDRQRPPTFVLVSSSEVYQDPPAGMYPTPETVPLSVPDVTNPRYSYGGGKIASELATLAYYEGGFLGRTIIVRPHNIYGPDMGTDHVIPQFAVRMMQAVRDGNHEFRIQGSGQESRSFCYIDDCIDGMLRLLGNGDGLVEHVYHLGNPWEEYSIRSLAEQVAEWFRWDVEVVPGPLPKGSPSRRAPDIARLMELNWTPKVSLQEGLNRTLEWYKWAWDTETLSGAT